MMPTPKDVELSYNDVEGVLMEQKEKDEEGKGIGQGPKRFTSPNKDRR